MKKLEMQDPNELIVEELIENTIRENQGELGRREIANKAMYDTRFLAPDMYKGIRRLEAKHKVIFHKKKATWIFYPQIYRKLMKQTKPFNGKGEDAK